MIRHVANDDEFQDWSSWLSCDRLVSLCASHQATPNLFALIEADDAGLVCRSCRTRRDRRARSFTTVQKFTTQRRSKAGDVVAWRRFRRRACDHFRAGRYTRHWDKNCVAIGSAAAVLAPMKISALQVGTQLNSAASGHAAHEQRQPDVGC